MPDKYKTGAYNPSFFPRWKYRGGQTVTMTGAPVACTIPNNAQIFEVRAEGGAVYFNINHGNANANSPGYVADGAGSVVGPLDTFTALTLYGTAGVIAHVMYFEEA